MPKSKNSDREHEHEHERERKRHEHEHEHRRRSDRQHEEIGDDPKAHMQILERRWLGSPPPTAQRYARAIEQWHALPGAVMYPPSDVTGTAETKKPGGSAEEKSNP